MEVGDLIFVRSAERVARIKGYDFINDVMTYQFVDGNRETITVETTDTPEGENGEFQELPEDYFGENENYYQNDDCECNCGGFFSELSIFWFIILMTIIASVSKYFHVW